MAATRCFQKVLELEPSNKEAQQEVGALRLYFTALFKFTLLLFVLFSFMLFVIRKSTDLLLRLMCCRIKMQQLC